MGPPAPMPIGWAPIETYADATGCGADARATLHQVISALDRRWLEEERGRMQAEMAALAAKEPR